MRLLVITQKINKDDQVLGFFDKWLLEFEKNTEKLTIVCLEKSGDTNLSEKTKILSLGKEANTSKLQMIFRLHKYIWSERKNYDKVFVHMNPIYLVLLGICWKILGKESYLWYMHKSVDWKLKFGINFVRKVFSATKESFRLKTDKLVLTGHGIDTELFKPGNEQSNNKKILTLSRISQSKRIDLIIESLNLLPEEMTLDIVGGPITENDKTYLESLKNRVEELGLENRVNWVGPVSNDSSVSYYQNSNVFVNVSETGSLDKTILEALSCGLPVVSSNDSASEMESVYRTSSDPEKLTHIIALALENGAIKEGREVVEREHGLERLIKKLIEEMKN